MTERCATCGSDLLDVPIGFPWYGWRYCPSETEEWHMEKWSNRLEEMKVE